MMVGYTHDSKTLWRIWDPEFQKVKAQSDVIINEERNGHMSCQHQATRLIPICLYNQKTRNIWRNYILEISLSEDKAVNLHSRV